MAEEDDGTDRTEDDLVLVHQMRNRLAGILTNVDLVEMLLRDANGSLSTAQRDDMLSALGYARTSGRELALLLRALVGKNG